MKTKHFLTTLALCATLPMGAQILQTTVAQGEIAGELHDGAALYKAIPYAEAPVGNLRWKSPVSKAPWQGVYKAEKWGDRPPQTVDPNQGGAGLGMSEDCLYLSVCSPAKTKDEKLPVFVMIHGGGFSTGSYSGTQESFVREGIVYCSIEYRLGALGFMCHPELSKESPTGLSGNYGLQDQIMALRWIHDNIAAFGGDPEKITIAGESAGGISVSMLCASPQCKGLFRGAISESGSSFWPVSTSRGGNTSLCTAASQENYGLQFQKRLGAKNLKALRKMPWRTLVDSTKMEDFWPVVDGIAIVDDQYKLYEQGLYNDVNVLAGTNSDEGSLFSWPMPVPFYEGRIRATYGEWADKVLALYPATNEQEVYFGLSDIFRDGTFAWGTWAWGNLQHKTGKGKFYLYYFDQDSEVTILRSRKGGAAHVAEMPFIYGFGFGPGKEMTETEKHMLQIMSRYWINFTKTGDPNSEGLPYWTAYDPEKPTTMNIREGFRLTEVPNLDKLQFFEEYFNAKRQ